MTASCRVSIALVAALAGCARDDSDEPSASRPAPAEPERPAATFRIALPAPDANGPRANLTVGLTGEHLAAVQGADDIAVEGGTPVPGRPRTFGLRAHETELQRLSIGGADVLVRVLPGAEMRLGDQPCFGWEFRVPWLEPGLHATRPDESGTCPNGARALPADYRCPADAVVAERCCLPVSTLSFAGAGDAIRSIHAPGGAAVELPEDETLEVVAGGCGFHTVETDAGRVGLAVGFGRHWRLSIDERGVVTGTVGSRQP